MTNPDGRSPYVQYVNLIFDLYAIRGQDIHMYV